MDKKTYDVEVIMKVRVTVDQEKFDESFMDEFRQSFYPFCELEDHVEHLAQLKARGILSENFIEGYGPAAEMGIEVSEADVIELAILGAE